MRKNNNARTVNLKKMKERQNFSQKRKDGAYLSLLLLRGLRGARPLVDLGADLGSQLLRQSKHVLSVYQYLVYKKKKYECISTQLKKKRMK